MTSKTLLAFTTSAFLVLSGCRYANKQQLLGGSFCDTISVTYSGTVQSIFNAHCNSCHSGAFPSGGIKLDLYSSAKNLADNGKLWGSINHQSGYSAMPQGGPKLDPCVLDKIRAWINAGAPNN